MQKTTWILALFVASTGCSPTLSARDWVEAVPESACTVTVHRGDATGEWQLTHHHGADGRVLGGTTRLAYHGHGRELFEYDAAGRLVLIRSFDETAATTFPCDAEGGCDTPARRELVVTSIAYDARGRLRRRERQTQIFLRREDAWVRQRAESTRISREYEDGRLVAVDNGVGTSRLRWEGARLLRVDVDARYPRHVTVENDAEGRIVRTSLSRCTPEHECHPDDVTTYQYDDRGRLLSAEHVDPEGEDRPRRARWEYDGAHLVRVTNTENGSAHVFEYGYDELGRLTSVVENGRERERRTYEGRCDQVRVVPPDPSVFADLGIQECQNSPGYVVWCA